MKDKDGFWDLNYDNDGEVKSFRMGCGCIWVATIIVLATVLAAGLIR